MAYKDNPGAGGSYAMDKFVPQIWSSRILKNLHEKQRMAALATREYEGEIQGKGDTVKIHGVGPVEIRDYVTNKTGGGVTYDVGSDTEILVTVEKAKYFAFKVEDIEKAQANPKFVSELTNEAAVAMALDTDAYLLSKMVAAANDIGSAGGPKPGGSSSVNGGVMTLATTNKGDIYESIVNIGVRLDDLLCPSDGRFLVVPSFAYGVLLKEPLFVGAATAGQAEARDNGVIGKIAGFEIIQLPHSAFVRAGLYDSVEGVYTCLAGRRNSFAYVEQISSVETIRLENAFANGVRGLHLYGGGAIRQECLVACEITRP